VDEADEGLEESQVTLESAVSAKIRAGGENSGGGLVYNWEGLFMARITMKCPFPGVVCKECPVYRGRHYYLCFSEKYRGSLPGAKKDLPMSKKNSNSNFEMSPEVEGVKIFDPFEFDLFDIDTKEIKRRRSPK
jgi:hypothetical protein